MTDPAVTAWANARLSSILGIPDVSDVTEYLLGIQSEGELAEFIKGMLPDESDAEVFLKELKAVKSGARPAATAAAAPAAAGQAKKENAASEGQRTAGASGRGGALSETAKRLNEARELLSIGGKKAQEEAAAYARLQRAMVTEDPVAGSTGPSATSYVTADGTVAYEKKKDEEDFFGFGGENKKKKKGKKEKSSAGASGGQDGGNSSEEVHQEPAKPKMSRAARAQMLTASFDKAFLAPGRHLTKWVGNGTQYSLVGNCLDCGKILSDQEGAGPCLVCGSEQVYVAETNAMLDGTPVDQQLMAKRRRGGGDEGEYDEHDLQMMAEDPAASEALLKALDLRDKLIDFEQHRAERTVVIDDQSDYFDSASHWLTDDQRAKAERAEKEFLARLEKRRGGQPVMFSIDIAGRRIYGGDPDEAQGAGAAPTGGETAGQASPEAGAATDGAPQGGPGRGRLRGPTVDLMGPTGQQDMVLGAQYTPKVVDLTNSSLSGRALEVYQALRKTVKNPNHDGAKSSRGGGRVQHDSGYIGGGAGLHLGGLEGGDIDDEDLPGTCGAGEEVLGGCATDDDEVAGKDGGMGGLAEGVTEHGEETGMCLSMHQPWASLVVHGIKQVEGRQWPTRHRGRLWIASTKRKPLDVCSYAPRVAMTALRAAPLQEEVDQVLAQYAALQELRPAHAPVFKEPEAYPTSALLGCVDLVDCVEGQVLREVAEDGEEATECEYGFVLDRPCRLTVPFKALGQPKIFKLDPVMVTRAQKQLRHVIPTG